MKYFLFLILFSFGCGEIGKTLSRNPELGIGAGAIAAGTAQKVKQDLKEISTLAPYLNLRTIEVCYHTEETGLEWLECILTPCNKEPCKRWIKKKFLKPYKTAYIQERGWLEHSGSIKAMCTSPHENFRKVCRFYYKNYNDIDRIFIVGDK